MNKAVSFGLLTLLVVSMLGMASAGSTVISGTIYNADYTSKIEGATVSVVCGVTHPDVLSQGDGSYIVSFDTSDCDLNDNLVVSASKDGLYGTNGGELVTCPSGEGVCLVDMKEKTGFDLKLATVDVPLVPEFGFFAGAITILGALCVFFLVRRK